MKTPWRTVETISHKPETNTLKIDVAATGDTLGRPQKREAP